MSDYTSGGGGGGRGGDAKIIGNGGTAIGGAGGGGGGGGSGYAGRPYDCKTIETRYVEREPTRQQRLDAAALAALTGLLADPNVRGTIPELTESAYDYAEAMLAESDRRSQTPAP